MQLPESIESLKKTSVKKLVDRRIKEFKRLGKGSNNTLFKELCFCVLTANYNAEKAIKIQKEIGNGFLTFPESKLSRKLKTLGYRYPNNRAKYIVDNRKHLNSLKEILNSRENKAREWLIREVKGIGYKEASHFLRNTGCDNCAIIDFHIIDVLVKHKLIKRPKTLTKKRYLEIEKLLKKLAQRVGVDPAELDLYLWYMETGKVLK